MRPFQTGSTASCSEEVFQPMHRSRSEAARPWGCRENP